MRVVKKINLNVLQMDSLIQPEKNFDIIKRNIKIGGTRESYMYYVDGFLKDEMMQEIMRFMLLTTPDAIASIKSEKEYLSTLMPYPEITLLNNIDDVIFEVLSGSVALFVDDFEECIIIDVRQYPQRNIQEPEKDKVLRGAKDGFIETLIFNIALIRRRVRNKDFMSEYISVGSVSKTDVVVCYMKGEADQKLVDKIKEKLNKLDVKTLTMGSQSLTEAMQTKKWINPFPKVRFTERPDVASASILEGKILILVDNTPSAIILPTYFFDFFEEAQDFYFSPPISGFLRISRFFIVLMSLLLTPLWLLAINNMDKLPDYLHFLNVQESNSIPIIFQLLALEFIIHLLKSASINTPSMISNSISLVGAIIIGDIAVTTKLIVPEAMLYSGVVAIAYFSQTSYEMGYAIKFMRVIILILVAIFNVWGFIAGIVLTIITIASNKAIIGENYLYPLIPFNYKDFKRMFIRRKNG
ncbi:MAG: spore germination protein [Clostridia bacterium]